MIVPTRCTSDNPVDVAATVAAPTTAPVTSTRFTNVAICACRRRRSPSNTRRHASRSAGDIPPISSASGTTNELIQPSSKKGLTQLNERTYELPKQRCPEAADHSHTCGSTALRAVPPGDLPSQHGGLHRTRHHLRHGRSDRHSRHPTRGDELVTKMIKFVEHRHTPHMARHSCFRAELWRWVVVNDSPTPKVGWGWRYPIPVPIPAVRLRCSVNVRCMTGGRGGSLNQRPRRLCGQDRVDFHVASADNSTRLGTATTGRPGGRAVSRRC